MDRIFLILFITFLCLDISAQESACDRLIVKESEVLFRSNIDLAHHPDLAYLFSALHFREKNLCLIKKTIGPMY